MTTEHKDNKLDGKPRAPCPNCKQILGNAGIGPDDKRLAKPYNPPKS